MKRTVPCTTLWSLKIYSNLALFVCIKHKHSCHHVRNVCLVRRLLSLWMTPFINRNHEQSTQQIVCGTKLEDTQQQDLSWSSLYVFQMQFSCFTSHLYFILLSQKTQNVIRHHDLSWTGRSSCQCDCGKHKKMSACSTDNTWAVDWLSSDKNSLIINMVLIGLLQQWVTWYSHPKNDVQP